MVGRMQAMRWKKWSALLCLMAALNVAFGQGVPDNFWDGFAAKMRRGCVEMQMTSSANQALKREVVEDACDCMARQVTSRAKGSPEFVTAVSMQDRDAMPRLMASMTTEPDGRHVLATCTERVMAAQGGLAGAVKADGQASKEKVLKGRSRSSFVDEATRSCVGAPGRERLRTPIAPAQVTGYCRCVAEDMADHLSEQDLVDAMKSNGKTKTIQEARSRMDQACSKKYLN